MGTTPIALGILGNPIPLVTQTTGRDEMFVEVAPDNVVVLARKPAEGGVGFVVRLQETDGRTIAASVVARPASLVPAEAPLL